MTTIVYKTTNLINSKIYIGVHRKFLCKACKNFTDCNYLGSNRLLSAAIEKYGRNNFSRETLFEYNNYIDAFNKEKELVDIDFVKNNATYNLRLGGEYGLLTEESRKKIGAASSIALKGKKLSPQTIEKIRLANIGRKRTKRQCENISRSLKGHKVSERTRKNISLNSRSGELEIRKKISLTLSGAILPQEVKDKISKSMKNKQKSSEHRKNMVKAWELRRLKMAE